MTRNGPDIQRITLSCRHEIDFRHAPPMLGDEVWCVKCQHMREVVAAPVEYRVRCKRCPYARRFGVARLKAEVAAAKHHQRTTHRVRIYNGKELIYEMPSNSTADKYASEDTPLSASEDAPF